MSPEGLSPREGVEHYRRLMPAAEVQRIAGEHGVSLEEAEKIAMDPIEWMARLAEGDDPAAVVTDAEATLAELEERFGPSRDVDESRAGLVLALLTQGRHNTELAMRVLAKVEDSSFAIEEISKFGMRSLAKGALGLQQLLDLSVALRNAFVAAGRGSEFDARNLHTLKEMRPAAVKFFTQITGLKPAALVEEARLQGDVSRFAVPTELRPAKPEDDIPAPEDSAQTVPEKYPHTPWAELNTLAENINNWPDGMTLDERLRLVVDFGKQLSDVLGAGKIHGKGAESIKAFIAKQQNRRGGEAWDQLRFIAASGFYARGGEKFGRIMTRNMDDPVMMAMVVHFLLEDGRDAHAMEVMQDLPDYRLYGKMLAVGDWQDEQRIAVMIEDITRVLPTARRKHNPAFRIGVAEGLYEHYAGQPGDAAAEKAEKFRARAALLQKQIDMGYIASPQKK